MGSNDASSASFDLKIISITVIIALIIGAGIGYMVGNSPILGYKEEIDLLETENINLEDQKKQLQVELHSTQAQVKNVTANLTATMSSVESLESELLDKKADIETIQLSFSELEGEYSLLQEIYQDVGDEYSKLQSDNDELQVAFESLNQSYADLLSCLDSTVIDSYVQSIEYNFSAGTTKTWEFLIPEYGIIWEATLGFYGNSINIRHAWRRGEERYFVGSSGITITREGSVHYYGFQEHLWGIVKVEYYLSIHDLNKIWVLGTITTNLPTIGGPWSAYIDI